MTPPCWTIRQHRRVGGAGGGRRRSKKRGGGGGGGGGDTMSFDSGAGPIKGSASEAITYGPIGRPLCRGGG